MSESAEPRAKLLEQLLDDFRRQYQECGDTWKTLETKAQVAMTVGGVFLAAVFAFARDLTTMTCYDKVMLGSAILSLVGTVVCGLFVFFVVDIEEPPLGTSTQVSVFDMLKKPNDELPSYIEQFSKQQATDWTSAIKSIDDANEQKAAWVLKAHFLLLLSVVITAGFTLSRVIRT